MGFPLGAEDEDSMLTKTNHTLQCFIFNLLIDGQNGQIYITALPANTSHWQLACPPTVRYLQLSKADLLVPKYLK